MPTASIDCRLCGESALLQFTRQASDGDAVSTYLCRGCRSLQTENPLWLAAGLAQPAQGPESLNLDTYAVERSLRCRMAVFFLWKLGGLSSTSDKLLDWGGGPGLLVRMLRDVGIDAYNDEKYVRNHFASGFGRRAEHRYAMVTSFEVFEHFARPASDLNLVFSTEPSMVLVSTCLYRGQGPDWPYLGPPKSGHVFFYGEEAMRLIGRRYGYQVELLPDEMVLFSRRPLAPWRMRALRWLLAKPRRAEIAFALKRKWSLSGRDNRSVQQLIEARAQQPGG